MTHDTPPKRIWATEDRENHGEDAFHSTRPFPGGVEYILASEVAALIAANAALEAKVAGLRDFVDDFAKAKIDALRYSPPYGSSPEDDPDPVVDAETVWAWQADAKAALATQEAGT